MITDIDQKQFESVIYAATNATADVYNACLPYMENAEDFIKDRLLDEGLAALSTDEKLSSLVRKFICESGFLLAIPHLDLVLTNTGFGVVSNDHVAPASRERVNALMEALRLAYDRTLCDITRHLFTVEGWGKNPRAKHRVTHVLYHIDDAERLMPIRSLTHSTWMSAVQDIYDAYFHLCRQLGDSFIDGIRDKMICNAMTEEEEAACEKLREVIAYNAAHKDDKHLVRVMTNEAVEWFDQRADLYPGYKDGSPYKSRHYEEQTNREKRKSFFFGC